MYRLRLSLSRKKTPSFSNQKEPEAKAPGSFLMQDSYEIVTPCPL